MLAHVARVIVIAPGQLEVIRRSIKEVDKNYTLPITFSSERTCYRRRT